MIKLLVRAFIKDGDNVTDKTVREKHISLGGVLGIICNLVLFVVKLVIGGLMHSLAITSDAFNNLSDMGTSVMAVIGAKLSNKKPDADHPFGHGRFEYISSLIISFLIMLVGFELLKSSFEKIINPEPIVMKPILLVILILSVLVKLWMFSYNRYLGKKIDSGVLKAASKDSLNDVIATSAVILSTALGYYLDINIDGYIGVAVSILIMIVGFNLARETVDILLGSAPDKDLIQNIEKLVGENRFVLGIHDLIVHDYGPGRVFASLHAEVSDKENVTVIHEEIDALEVRALAELGIELVIHMDPITTDSSVLNDAKNLVLGIVAALGDYTIHDFRMTDGENRVNLIFDIVVPCTMLENDRQKLVNDICAALKETNEKYCAVIKIDNDYAAKQ